MAKTPENHAIVLNILLIILCHLPHFLCQKTTLNSLLTCLNHHKLTNYSTPTSKNFNHLHTFSLQNLILKQKQFRKPDAIILPETKEQLIHAVLCCKRSHVQIRVRGGGHSYEGLSSMPSGTAASVILDMMNFNRVFIDVETESAWVEGGATLGELYTAVAEKSGDHGFPAGVGPTVGVGGHFSGGGIGVMARKYGLSADNVVDLELIDAEGRVLGRADMGEDVYWATLGGGGGNFGVVYKWKVQLVKVLPKVTCFMVTKKSLNNELAKLVYKWQYIAPKLDDEFYLAIYLTSGATNEVYATFVGFYLGSKDKAMTIKNQRFSDLDIGEDEYKEMSWIESVLYFSGLPDGSTISDLKSRYFTSKSCVKTKSDYVREYVSIEGLEGALEMVSKEPKGLVILDPYGGIMDRISSDAIAFPHRNGNLYNILYVTFWGEEEDEARYLNWLRNFYDYMTPYVSSNPRTAYVNYVDLDLGSIDLIDDDDDYDNVVEKVRNWGEKYFLGNYERLVKAKTIIDPNNVFNHLQGIHPNNAQTYQCLVNLHRACNIE